jgi:hypothetical protein
MKIRSVLFARRVIVPAAIKAIVWLLGKCQLKVDSCHVSTIVGKLKKVGGCELVLSEL